MQVIKDKPSCPPYIFLPIQKGRQIIISVFLYAWLFMYSQITEIFKLILSRRFLVLSYYLMHIPLEAKPHPSRHFNLVFLMAKKQKEIKELKGLITSFNLSLARMTSVKQLIIFSCTNQVIMDLFSVDYFNWLYVLIFDNQFLWYCWLLLYFYYKFFNDKKAKIYKHINGSFHWFWFFSLISLCNHIL